MEADTPSLEARIGSAVLALDRIRDGWKWQNRLRNLAVSVSTVVAVAAIFVGVQGRDQFNTYKSDTQKARVASCRQFNVQQFRNRAAFKDAAEVLVAQARNPSPETARFIAKYRAATAEKAAADFPDRDCSAIGIARYLGQTARQP